MRGREKSSSFAIRDSQFSLAEREPIAIVGIGCRFPGDANDADSFWRLLRSGRDAITEVPQDRWSVDAYYHPKSGLPGKSYSRWGGFIKGLDLFEPEFFGISPREAAHMDPQQRLLMEVAWEALEDGGLVIEALAGSPTGVFVGISTFDYAQMQSNLQDHASMDAHYATGGALSIAANRISYFLGTRGPSLAVDTACSSSLVAIDLACRSIWSGECSLGLAGGVNAIIMPSPFIAFCAASMLSPEGRCKAFDAEANGFVRGEGAGIVLLKPLSKAVAAGDRIYALIVGSGVNQDGRTGGLTVPSREAQEALLRKVYEEASVEPDTVHYVEAHGTGTEVGDPIEARAIGGVLSRGRAEDSPCIIGSVKTNIGHLEAAAGIAGVIKTALALKHRTIPPNLHFRRPNPRIPFDELKLRVPVALEPWPGDGGAGIAGVNSFGFGGTNAHIVLKEYIAGDRGSAKKTGDGASGAHLIPLSARTPQALEATARSYVELLEGEVSLPLADLAYSASVRRSHLDHRLSLVAADADELRDRLQAFLAGEERPGSFAGKRPYGREPKVVFVFSGQGSQWWGMGRQLLRDEPVFGQVIEKCDRLLRGYADWSLLDELSKSEADSRLHETAIAQPALFALQTALAELWRSWGVTPDAVLGHSVGEVAAAYVAGALDIESAVRVIFHRGRCMDFAAARGKMLAVTLPEPEAAKALSGYDHRVVLAAVNAPSSTVLSGEAPALEEISACLTREGVLCRFLPVEYAFHSPQMEPLKQELLQALSGLDHRPPTLPVVSSVTGAWVEGDLFGAEYWWRNVRQKVLFSAAMSRLAGGDYDAFLELSPHPVLLASVSECLAQADRKTTVLPSLRRQADERSSMLSSLGALHALGSPVKWQALWPHGGGFGRLPTTPWQRQRYWQESERLRELRVGVRRHPLLQRRPEPVHPSWEVGLDKRIFSFLEDHTVQGKAVVPAVAYIEAALGAARDAFGPGVYVLEELKFQKVLFLPDGGEPPSVQLVFQPDDASLAIHSRQPGPDQSWELHAAGYMRAESDPSVPGTMDLEALRSALPQEISAEYWYAKSEEFEGVRFGPSFRGIQRVWRKDGEILGRIALPSSVDGETDRFCFHPVLLDACLQLLGGAVPPAVWSRISTGAFLPVRLGRLRFYRSPEREVWSRVVLKKTSPRLMEGDVEICDGEGRVLMRVDGFQCQNVGMRPADADIERLFYEVQWRRKELPERRAAARSADFLPAPRQIGRSVENELFAAGAIGGGQGKLREAEESLDALATAYAASAMRELGWRLRPGERLTISSLTARSRLDPGRAALALQVVELFEKSAILDKTATGDWLVRRELPDDDPRKMWLALLARHADFAAELWLIARCGEQLTAALRGENVYGSSLSNGATPWLEHFYQDSPSWGARNRIVESVIGKALESLPDGESIRILDKSGGTEGLSARLLPGLSGGRVEYVLAGESEAFLERAQDRLRRYPFARVQLLDLRKEPAGQGFEPQSFDLFLGRDEALCRPDPRPALDSILKLLAPGGLLALQIVPRSRGWFGLVSECIEDGWRSEVSRTGEPAPYPPDRWPEALPQALKDAGYGECAWVPSALGEGDCFPAALLARAPRLEREARSQEPVIDRRDGGQGFWLIFADRGGVAQALARGLEGQGDKAILIFPGEEFREVADGTVECSPADPEEMDRLLRWVDGRGQTRWRGIVHFWSLEGALNEPSLSSLRRAEEVGCSSLLHLVQALSRGGRRDRSFRLMVVTRGAQPVGRVDDPPAIGPSLLIGLAKVVTNEFPDLRCKTVDLDGPPSPDDADFLVAELMTEDPEEEVALRRESRWTPRLDRAQRPKLRAEALPKNGSRAFRLEISTPGSIDHLVFRETARRRPGPGQVEIKIEAAALNFRDVMKALGLYPMDGEDALILGDECSGRIVAVGDGVADLTVGDQVFGLTPASLGNYALTEADFVTRRPAHLSAEEAATIPVAFLTAYYALVHLGRLRAGERVLIHSAAGGVGLAAVQIARLAGAEIFATAGSHEKREFLERLDIPHVMDSRSLSFADRIMDATGGRGVDVVLNSLGGKAIAKGLSCLAPYGRFLELGKRDIYQDGRLGLWEFRKNLSFFAIDLGAAMRERRELLRSLFVELRTLIETEKIRPLPYRLFQVSRAAEAFRHMAQAKHVGKIVLSMSGGGLEIEALDERRPLFRPDATYLVTGGLGGFGLAVARWIAENGGRSLALMGRSGAASAEARTTLEDLSARGVRVTVAQADVSDEKQVADLIHRIDRTLPPLKGVFHAAMVLDDGILLQMDRRRFRQVLAPKVDGAWNLHRSTLDSELDYFVLFSSVSSLIGNQGQANYVAANAFLDALAHYRRTLDLPAVSINWGHLAEVGYVSRREKLAESLTARGVEAIRPVQALEALGLALKRKPAQIGVMRMDWQKLARSAHGRFPRLLSSLVAETPEEKTDLETGAYIRGTLHQAEPEERARIAERYVREQVARVLGTSPAKLDAEQPLSELGLDSLMAIELKTRIETDLVLSLPAGRLVQGPSIKKLAAEVLYQLAKEKEYGGEVMAAPEPAAPSAAAPRLVPLRAGGAAPPLFCIHPGRGAADIYQAVANLLPPALPVYGVQSEVLNGSRSVEEMAKEHARAVRGGQPEGPYYLLGFSLGGFIALATAKRLEEEGESVAFVGLIDCDAGWTNPSNFVVGNLISETYRLIQSGTSFLEPLSPDRLAEETAKLSETLLAALPEERVGIIMQWLKKNGHVRKGLSQAALNEYLAAFNQHVGLVADFEPPVVRAPLFVWWADEGLSNSGNGNRTWAGFTTGPVMERTLRGSHYSIMHPPAAALLAEEIGRSLAAVSDS